MCAELNFSGKRNRSDILKDMFVFSPIIIKGSALIYGDNFNAMSSLVNGNMKGKIDLVYIDPPFNTNQNFLMSEERVGTISRAANGIVAYSDNKSLDEYLAFIRDRLVAIHELLSEKGSLYLHIDNKVGHYIKIILDEIFGCDNFKNDITRKKSNPKNFKRRAYGNQKDTVLFYSKNKDKNIWNEITVQKSGKDLETSFRKIDNNGRRYTTVPVHAPGETQNGETGLAWKGMLPPKGRHWRVKPAELDRLDNEGLIEWSKNGVPRLKKYADEHKGNKIQDIWSFIDPQNPNYPTEKNLKMIEGIILQSSNENSIVLDCFAGGGTTLLAASNTKRTFIGIDNSQCSIRAIKKRLEGISFDFIDAKTYADNDAELTPKNLFNQAKSYDLFSYEEQLLEVIN
ncbi:MAG: site-specific DNA-methyltransferase [Clostridiales bacterium]|jgi:adenine-specific DNA-methyltransferase|nr:site-specific DNA-methyltransferase [Clostridiales bacterium]